MAEELEQQNPPAAAPAPAQPAAVVAEPAGEPAPVLNPNFTRAYGTGRRKEAVARVYLLPGSGKFTVNGRTVEDFFPRQTLRFVVFQPLEATATKPLFDVKVTVRGGGPMGQAGAVRLGVARALLEYNIELRKKLKKLGFLTRDARVHERKKYGQKGARKRFQFSKR
jgi:small subunit ribosomal protein S9